MNRFEWALGKERENIQKHGISFARAAKMFRNPVVRWVDDRWDYGETRMIAIGHNEGFFMRVTYTLRGRKIRIISAQKAKNHDKRQYQRKFG
jgi:uncharacterized protein